MSTCRAGAAATDDATCDAFDDDCDGVLDEDAPVRASACGVGLCSSTGFELCAGGALVNNCAPGAALLNDATCDGLDQDCDGRVDEDAVDAPVSCGVGECMRVGVRRCLGGRLVSDCAAGAPSADTDCDGRDDDCDGRVDESFLVTRTTCGVGACASAGLRSCTPNGPQDSCAPIPPAPTDAVCDGVDSDCDGRVDEGYTRATVTCGVGACENHALTACVAGAVVSSCSPNAGSAQPDTSCDGFDDDCDGRVDEAYAPRAVTCPQGACAPAALEVCTLSGLTNTCVLSPAQSDPTCNGVDDDCDGLVDEDYAPAALDEPLSCGEGVCVGEGVLACLAGSVVVSCAPDLSLATPDSTCDGVDDDCDGRADESFGLALTCGVGACARQGAARCVEGARLDQCAPGAPSAERCGDGVDNDCDGSTDEGFAALGAPCAVGVGACAREGVEVCGADALSTSCSAAPGAPSAELCNGVDDDCDGVVDESPTDAGAPCVDPTRFGVCAQGLTRCVGGSLSCEGDDGRAAAEEDYCTPADDDCDPATPALPTLGDVVPFNYTGVLRDSNLYVVQIRVGDRCGNLGSIWRCAPPNHQMQCYYAGREIQADCGKSGTICCNEQGFVCQ